MEKIQTVVSLALRDTETCTAAAEVREIPHPGSPDDSDSRRVLAVITHKYHKAVNRDVEGDEDGSEEEGCLFVLKYKFPLSAELYPYLLFPIDSSFSTSLEQQNGPDNSEFKITLTVPKASVMLGSRHMPTLSSVLEETRRLRKVKDSKSTILSPKFQPGETTGDSAGTELSSRIEDDSKSDPPRGVLSGYDSDRNTALESPITEEDSGAKNVEPHRSDLDQKRGNFKGSNPPGSELQDNSTLPGENPSSSVKNDGEERHWEWLHFYLSHRSNRILPSQRPKPRDIRFVKNGYKLSQASAAFPGDEDNDVALIRDHWIQRQLSLRKDEYSQRKTLRIRIGTFNVNNAPPTQSLSPWILSSNNDQDLPDIFILGFQELDLSAEALLYSNSTMKADAWISAVFAALGQEADSYVKLASKQLVGVVVVVILRKEIQSMVKDVSTSAAGVGLMGIMGNKGATAVRLCLDSTTATFVCSHLAAFDEYVDRRNSDFAEIARKLEFPVTWSGPRGQGPQSLIANIWETDMLFWLGLDLNYRIDLPDEEIRTLLRSEPRGTENSTLLVYDQLRTSARHKRAFVDFKEHVIKFPPTYRFNEDFGDQLGYDRKRKPAWTDRILHLCADPSMVSQKSYQYCPMIKLSDHRPVSADFDIEIYEHDSYKLHAVAHELFRKLGDFEDSASIPTVTILDDPEVHLGSVSYMKPISRSIQVRNDGELACAFRFIPLEPGSPICKEWLQLQLAHGILLPGETESIQITVNIDTRTASFMNHGNTQLEDNLILHLANGTDHIISVLGSYQPTCFANSLAWLVRSPGPIRTHGHIALLPEVNTLSAPRELMFLVGWLISNAQDVHDLFIAPADESLVHIIREHLDTQHLDSITDISFPDNKDHRDIALAFGEALLQFLDSLTEPVIPWVLHSRCAAAQGREDVFEILDDVPGFARNVYVTVTAFLHFIAQNGGPERSIALARVFADILLRDNPRALQGVPDLTPLGKRNFLLHTIA